MKLTGDERRNKIISLLEDATEPLSGSMLVTDIALLRASRSDIVSTTNGYLLAKSEVLSHRRIFKVNHTDEQIPEELTCITDLGGTVIDVYIDHKVYGTLSAPMNIKSRRDVQNFIADLQSGVSKPLKNITLGYHYHTVEAASVQILDEIEAALREKGFLKSRFTVQKPTVLN